MTVRKAIIQTTCATMTLVFCLISTNSFSQKKDDDNGKFGVVGGMTIASINEESAGNVSAFYAGISKEFNIVPMFRFQTGMLYLRNGATLNSSTYNLDYIQVPALLKVKFGPMYLMTGFKGGVRVGGSVTTAGVKESLDSGVFNNFDFGSQFGIGVNFLIIGLEARYNWGLTQVVKKDFEIDYNHRYLELGINIRLPF